MFSMFSRFKKRKKSVVENVYSLVSSVGENGNCFLCSDFQIHDAYRSSFETELASLVNEYRLLSFKKYANDHLILVKYDTETIITTKNEEFLNNLIGLEITATSDYMYFDLISNSWKKIIDLKYPHKKIFITHSIDDLSIKSLNYLKSLV